MRDPKRIPKVLAEVERLWKKHPDIRLGQFFLNLSEGNSGAMYYKEDEAVLDRLRELYEKPPIKGSCN